MAEEDAAAARELSICDVGEFMNALLLVRFEYHCWVTVLIAWSSRYRCRSGHYCPSLLTIEMRQNRGSCVKASSLLLPI